MSRLIVGVILVFFSFFAYGGNVNCFKFEEVKINNVYPNIKFSSDKDRKNNIKIRKMVDCETKLEMIPDTYQQAINMLSFSLPIDYLTASVVSYIKEGEANISIYAYSDYGASVDEDLIDFFHDTWGLDNKNNVCRKEFGKNYSTVESFDGEEVEIACFMFLKEKLVTSITNNLSLLP